MTAAKQPPPSAEDHWFTHDPREPLPPHELIISEARAVEEALARLGPGASDEAVRQELERLGVRVDVARIAHIRGEMHRGAGPARGARPSDLVRTEGETVPPPGAPAPGGGSGTEAARLDRPARPSDLVKTEGETVPPPRP